MPRLALLPALVLALAALGCDSGPDLDPVGDLVLSGEASAFLLETEDEFGCANYPLVVEVEDRPGRLTIDVLGVGEVEGCLRALGPASATVPGPAEPRQSFEVVLRKDGRTDTYAYACGIISCGLQPTASAPTFSRIGPRTSE